MIQTVGMYWLLRGLSLPCPANSFILRVSKKESNPYPARHVHPMYWAPLTFVKHVAPCSTRRVTNTHNNTRTHSLRMRMRPRQHAKLAPTQIFMCHLSGHRIAYPTWQFALGFSKRGPPSRYGKELRRPNGPSNGKTWQLQNVGLPAVLAVWRGASRCRKAVTHRPPET